MHRSYNFKYLTSYIEKWDKKPLKIAHYTDEEEGITPVKATKKEVE